MNTQIKQAAYSPAPWEMREPGEHGKDVIRVVHSAGKDFTGREFFVGVADILWHRPALYTDVPSAEERANAHLIAAAPDLLAELRDRSQALGGVKILLLQNDLTGAMEILDRYELVFTDGPIMTSPAIAKAEPQGSQS